MMLFPRTLQPTYQLVMGHKVLDENGEQKVEHKYVFAPDGKHTTLFNV